MKTTIVFPKVTDPLTIKYLQIMARTHDVKTRGQVATKNRIAHFGKEHAAGLGGPETIITDIVDQDDKLLKRLSRNIGQHLENWPIWTEWLTRVPGIGPTNGANLILRYYYRSVPVCKSCAKDIDRTSKPWKCSACGKEVKGKGVFHFRIEMREFPNVSAWWKYMGVHCGAEGTPFAGRKPKMRKNVTCDWSPGGRLTAFFIGEAFVKAAKNNPYRDFYDMRKKMRLKTHPNTSQAHRHAMARHETAKLFLAHFIQVAKTIEGEPFPMPYAHTLMGHTHFIEPFLFDRTIYSKAA